MPDNYQRITEGFQLLTVALAPYACYQVKAQYGEEWWQKGVLDILLDHQRRDLPHPVMTKHWRNRSTRRAA